MTRRSVTALLIAAVVLIVTVVALPWVRGDAGTGVAAVSSPPPSSHAPASGPAPSSMPDPTRTPVGADAEPSGSAPSSAPTGTEQPTPPASPPTAATIPEVALERRLDRLRAKLNIPGASVTIIFADGSSWTGTSGKANVRADKPVEADTAFAIASVSKTFTAALILALAEEGAIDLDARVSTYLPAIKVAGKATVRQLLDHTSGLNDYFMHGRIDKHLLADRAQPWSPEKALGYVKGPAFSPGKGWFYSNTNYLLLGMVAEAVDGRPLADQLRDRFFDPLGLDHTYEQVGEKPRGPVAHGYRPIGTSAKPRFVDLSDKTRMVPFTSVVTAAHGTGSIAASSGDVARWARALYGGEVLSPDSLRSMIDDARKTARFRPKIPYGLGVQLVPLDGRRALGHSGRLTGFRSVVRHLPAEGITIAVLTNESRQDPSRIARSLLRLVLGAPPAS